MTSMQERARRSAEDALGGPTPLRRRRRLVLLVAVMCAASSAIGAGASTLIVSPSDRAARTAPPPATILTAKVEWRALTATVTVRGTVTAEAVVNVGGGGRANPIVSFLPVRRGQPLANGALVAEISGQPVVVLGGRLPAYRDLRAGDTGRDVSQLQNALTTLGLLPAHAITGSVDPATADAVGRMFGRLGYASGAGVPGIVLPMAAVAYLPASPSRVLSVAGSVGQIAPDALVTVACGGLAITSRVAPDQAGLVRPGMPADLVGEAIGKHTTGFVSEVGPLVTPNPADTSTVAITGTQPYVPLTITTKAPLGPEWSGQDVRVTLTQAKTSGPVLVVPISAVSAGADGRTTVTLRRGSATESVPVTVGATGDGFVQVEAGRRLKAGDDVVVGS
jgi:hypothetical protein